MQIRDIILGLDQNNLAQELNALFELEFDWERQSEGLAISWEEINRYKEDQLLTIGGHTKSHCNLKALRTEDEVESEILRGIELINEHTGIRPKAFAFPYGSTNEVGTREIEIASKCGIETACLAYGGYCTKRHSNSLLSLPRIMLTETFNEIQLV